jgi:outer membrane protein OmpA-like peptidoglycan-associated protein
MSMSRALATLATTAILICPDAAFAQTAAAPAEAKAPESLELYFDVGSATVRQQEEAVLDQASRLYRDGNPIVMIVAGSTDTLGAPELNLMLSQRRAGAVLRGLIERGIPAERFQIVAKGETDLSVATSDDVSEERNRRVEITWR